MSLGRRLCDDRAGHREPVVRRPVRVRLAFQSPLVSQRRCVSLAVPVWLCVLTCEHMCGDVAVAVCVPNTLRAASPTSSPSRTSLRIRRRPPPASSSWSSRTWCHCIWTVPRAWVSTAQHPLRSVCRVALPPVVLALVPVLVPVGVVGRRAVHCSGHTSRRRTPGLLVPGVVHRVCRCLRFPPRWMLDTSGGMRYGDV